MGEAGTSVACWPVRMAENPELDAAADAFAEAIRRQVRRARDDRQWTVEDLGSRLRGISPSEIAAYERGECDFDIAQVGQLLQALDLGLETVFRKAYDIATRHQSRDIDY